MKLVLAVAVVIGLPGVSQATPLTWGYTYSIGVHAVAVSCFFQGCDFGAPSDVGASSDTRAATVANEVFVDDSGDFHANVAGTAAVAGAGGHLGVGMEIVGNIGGQVISFANIFYIDQLTIVSPTLPVGTPVVLNGEMPLNFTGSCGADQPLPFQLQTLWTSLVATGPVTQTRFRVLCSGIPSFTINSRIGDTLNIGMSLEGMLSHNAFGDYLGGLNALHTLDLTLVPSTPDFSYVTASGNNFMPTADVAVPEPASLLLMTTGLIGLATRGARSRTARRRMTHRL
jgi:hypothetical protein